MPKELMSQEDLNDSCPLMVEELELILGESELFKDEEATIYALAQLLHNKIEASDFTEEDKGSLVATLIEGLVQFNQGPLAAHRELIKTILEGKTSTIH